ncbi:hypothetical protein ACE1OC_10215 [Streptomyces sp. DSM 116496]|uniref:hypothetical protein n=1 Tax=Streptomyces stoeckheimensis TaxID=3344656 RepID=UPI0038B25B1F
MKKAVLATAAALLAVGTLGACSSVEKGYEEGRKAGSGDKAPASSAAPAPSAKEVNPWCETGHGYTDKIERAAHEVACRRVARAT